MLAPAPHPFAAEASTEPLPHPSYAQLEHAYHRMNYAWFTGPFDLNVFGVAHPNPDQHADRFNDLLGIAWQDRARAPQVLVAPATVHPGLSELTRPRFANAQAAGTAILVPGQYRRAYQLGYHGSGAWRHRALRQVGPVSLYRDANRDHLLDMGPHTPTTRGLYGLHIHAASLVRVLQRIGRYSAGCQVIQRPEDYRRFVYLCEKQAAEGLGDRFTYTLFTAAEVGLTPGGVEAPAATGPPSASTN